MSACALPDPKEVDYDLLLRYDLPTVQGSLKQNKPEFFVVVFWPTWISMVQPFVFPFLFHY
jgi:hypothetical protein